MGAWLLALSAVVAGCSADAPPKVLPPVASPSANSSMPTDEPSPRVTPRTPESASQFARLYMSVLEQALATGDETKLAALSLNECTGCGNFIGAVRQLRQREQRVRGGQIHVLFAEAPAFDNGPVVVDMRYTRGKGQLVSKDGDTLEAIAAERALDAQVRLAAKGESWVVAGFTASPA